MSDTNRIYVKGRDNFVGFGCTDISLIDCNSCNVAPGVTKLVAINCDSMNFGLVDSGTVWIKGSKLSGSGGSKVVTASAAELVTGAYFLYYVDTSAGDVTIDLDVNFLTDMVITFKVIDATNNIIFTAYNTAVGTELFEWNAMPYTYTPTLGDSLTVTFNGTDFYII